MGKTSTGTLGKITRKTTSFSKGYCTWVLRHDSTAAHYCTQSISVPQDNTTTAYPCSYITIQQHINASARHYQRTFKLHVGTNTQVHWRKAHVCLCKALPHHIGTPCPIVTPHQHIRFTLLNHRTPLHLRQQGCLMSTELTYGQATPSTAATTDLSRPSVPLTARCKLRPNMSPLIVHFVTGANWSQLSRQNAPMVSPYASL